MDRRLIVLSHDVARQRAAALCLECPDGWHVLFRPPVRNLEINAALHATLGEIAARRQWAGKSWSIDAWKRLCVAAWSRATGKAIELAPALDGAGVDVIYSPTSEMSQAEVRDLLAWIEAWDAGAEP
jgi:hypothetical protein